MNKKIVAAAIATAFTLGIGLTAQAASDKVQCFGMVKAGKNSCGTGSHSCAGLAKTDRDPTEWVYSSKKDCLKSGGSLTEEDAIKSAHRRAKQPQKHSETTTEQLTTTAKDA